MNTKGSNNESAADCPRNQKGRKLFHHLLGADINKSTSERGLKKGAEVSLFVLNGGNVVNVGRAKLGTAGEESDTLQRTLHLHQLPSGPEQDLVVITSATFDIDKKSLPYPYTFKGSDGVPQALSDVFQAGFYAWDTKMMVVLQKNKADLESSPSSQDAVYIAPSISSKASAAGHPVTPNGEGRNLSAKGIAIEEGIVDLGCNESVECGKTVSIRRYSLDKYEKVQVWVLLDQILPPHTTLRDVDMAWVNKLQERFTKFDYEYSSGLMTVTILRSENEALEDLQLSSLLEGCEKNINCKYEDTSRKIKSGLMATVVDGLHRQRALNLLRENLNNKDVPKWLEQPIRMTLQIRSDLRDMKSTEILHLGAQRNQLAATVRPFSGLEQHISALRSYLKSFAAENQLEISEVRPTNLAEELSASGTIADFAFETYRRYARIAKVFATYPTALTRLIELNNSHIVKLGASHLDNNVFYQVDETGVILLMESVAAYVRNPETTGRFQNVQFYQYVKEAYEVLRHEYNRHGLPQQMSFVAFLQVPIKHSSLRKMSIREVFVGNMRLFLSAKKNQGRNLERIKRLGSRIGNHFSSENSTAKASGTAVSTSIDDVTVARTTGNKSLQDHEAGLEKGVKVLAGPLELQEKEKKLSSRDFHSKRHTTSSQHSSPSPKTSLRRSTREKRAPDPIQMRFKEKRQQKKRKNQFQRFDPIVSWRSDPSDEQEDLADEDGYRIPFVDRSDQKFDDLVPPLLPALMQDAEVYRGNEEPRWKVAVSLSPAEAEDLLTDTKRNGQAPHHTPLLNTLHIPLQHRAHVYMKVESILFLHRLAWLMGAKKFREEKKRNKTPCEADWDDSWEATFKKFRRGQGKPYFERQGFILQERGFCILEGFADSSSVPYEVLKKLKPPSENELIPVQQLLNHYLSTFPGEELCREEGNRNLWNPIVNLGEQGRDKDMQDHGKARYSSTRLLLMEYTEENRATRWASFRRAMLDVWMGQLAVLIGLEQSSFGKMYTPKTGGRFLITGENCPRQCPHNDFQVPSRSQRDRCPGYFMIATGDDPAPIWFSEYSHQFVFSPIVELQHFARALKLRLFVIPKNSVLLGHGFVTHAGAGYSQRLSNILTTRYHLYLTPEGVPLPDSIFFAFGSPLPGFQDATASKVKLPSQIASTNEQEGVGKQTSAAHSFSEQNSSEVVEEDLDKYISSSEGTEENSWTT